MALFALGQFARLTHYGFLFFAGHRIDDGVVGAPAEHGIAATIFLMLGVLTLLNVGRLF